MTLASAVSVDQAALVAAVNIIQPHLAVAGTPAAEVHHDLHLKRKRAAAAASAPTTAQALLDARFNEPLTSYFARLQPLALAAALEVHPRDAPFDKDGIYMHKRPVMGGGQGGVILALAGSVLHHVVLYIKAGDSVHKMDFCPANGADITSDLNASVPCRPILTLHASVPADDSLPFLYLGPATFSWDSAQVAQAIKFAEGRPYHALRNNCVHFADFVVRVMTGGALRSTPLIYDALTGGVPAEEPVMLALMPMVMGATWFQAVDGSPLWSVYVSSQAASKAPAAADAAANAADAAADVAVAADAAADDAAEPLRPLAHSDSCGDLPLKRQEGESGAPVLEQQAGQ